MQNGMEPPWTKPVAPKSEPTQNQRANTEGPDSWCLLCETGGRWSRGVPLIPQTVGPSEGPVGVPRDASCSKKGVVQTMVHSFGVLRSSGVRALPVGAPRRSGA